MKLGRRTRVIATVVLPLLVWIPGPVDAADKTQIVVDQYSNGPLPTSLCKTKSSVGGSCFVIPPDARQFRVVAQDSFGHYVHFRLILIDALGTPIVSQETYGEHCGGMPYDILAPESADRLVVEIAEEPAILVSWCPHVSDDGEIEVQFSAPHAYR